MGESEEVRTGSHLSPTSGRSVGESEVPAPPGEHLIAFILPLFHVVVLTIVLVMFAYAGGGFGEQLDAIGTMNGIALYGALCLSTTWTTRRALDGARSKSSTERGTSNGSMMAIKWGGLNGTVFFAALVVLYLINFFGGIRITGQAGFMAQLSMSELASGLIAFIPYIVIASIFAFGVGAVIGVGFSLLDRGAISIGGRLARWSMAEVDAVSPE